MKRYLTEGWGWQDRALAVLALALIYFLVRMMVGCSTPQAEAVVRSARVGYGWGDSSFDGTTSTAPGGYGMAGSSGAFSGDGNFDAWTVSIQPFAGLGLEDHHAAVTEKAYEGLLSLEREVASLRVELAAKNAAQPLPGLLEAKPIVLPEPEKPKPAADPPKPATPEPEVLILGMSVGTFSTLLGGIIAATVGILQRERIGNTARKIANAMPGKKGEGE